MRFLFAAVTFLAAVSAFSAEVNAQTTIGAVRPSSSGQSGDLGFGLIVGEPTGLTLKKWTTPNQAFDLALSYSFFSFFELSGNYLWHFTKAVEQITSGKVSSEFVPYAGIGGAMLFDISDTGRANGGPTFRRGDRSDVAFALRIPIGLEFLPRQTPLGIFAEIAPCLGLTPTTFAFLEGGVGARYYF